MVETTLMQQLPSLNMRPYRTGWLVAELSMGVIGLLSVMSTLGWIHYHQLVQIYRDQQIGREQVQHLKQQTQRLIRVPKPEAIVSHELLVTTFAQLRHRLVRRNQFIQQLHLLWRLYRTQPPTAWIQSINSKSNTMTINVNTEQLGAIDAWLSQASHLFSDLSVTVEQISDCSVNVSRTVRQQHWCVVIQFTTQAS